MALAMFTEVTKWSFCRRKVLISVCHHLGLSFSRIFHRTKSSSGKFFAAKVRIDAFVYSKLRSVPLLQISSLVSLNRLILENTLFSFYRR